MTNEIDETLQGPLNAVFSAPCHVAILRALFRTSAPASGRRVAREAGVNHQACAEGLRRLERLGLVQREIRGRTHAFSLQLGHPVVEQLLVPLYRDENGLAGRRTGGAAPLTDESLAPVGAVG